MPRLPSVERRGQDVLASCRGRLGQMRRLRELELRCRDLAERRRIRLECDAQLAGLESEIDYVQRALGSYEQYLSDLSRWIGRHEPPSKAA